MVAEFAIGPRVSPTYYSRAIDTTPPHAPRRRPRPGSVDRPINARLYRAAWLAVALPLLIAAFTPVRPTALPPPSLPPTFDGQTALRLAQDLATTYPDRSPGSPGSLGAARWLADQFHALGLTTETDAFSAVIPGRGRVQLRNLLAVVPGRSPEAIVVLAHRDSMGDNPGANDNASGTGALIELARGYAASATEATGAMSPQHTLIFLSTDGGHWGALGARRFLRSSPYAQQVVAAVNLDAIASSGRPRLEIAGRGSQSPSPSLVGTAYARLREQTGSEPGRASALGQLVDLAFPYSLYEQAAFLGYGIPALTLTTGGARPSSAHNDPARLDGDRLAQVGRAAQALLGSLDAGVELAGSTSSSWWVAGRMARGWAVQLVLVAMLVPFAAATADLVARCRRRRAALAPAFRSLRSRLGFWLWAGAVFLLFGLAGVWPQGDPAPVNPASDAAGHWPRLGLAGYAILVAASWLVARDRLVRRRPITREDELAGETAALVLLTVLSLLVAAVNAFALILLLPSLHAWLWLPQLRHRGSALRGAVFAAGLAGPLLLLGSFAIRFGLGLDAPWYLAELTAIGYVPIVGLFFFLCWLAAAAQLLAVATGRYAPYPSAAERGLGPLRRGLRAAVLANRSRRRRARGGMET